MKTDHRTHLLNQQIGIILRRYRYRRGETQREIAAKVGVTAQQIQKYETGTNSLSVPRILRYASALRVSPMELIKAITTAEQEIRCHPLLPASVDAEHGVSVNGRSV